MKSIITPQAEWIDKIMDIIEKHGENTSEMAIYWEGDEPKSLKKELKLFIKNELVEAYQAGYKQCESDCAGVI